LLRPLSWLGLLPKIVHERAALRRRLGAFFAKQAGLTGYVALHRVPPEAFHWLDLPERDDMFAAESVGGASTFLADARRAGLSVYTARWQLPEVERWAEALASLERDPPDLAFLYGTELDGTLHRVGNDHYEIEGVRERLSSRIARAHELMSRGGADVTTLLVGDHGMADVRRVVDPREVVGKIHPARVFVDSTMVRFWGDGPALDQARVQLERAKWPGRWLTTDDLRARRSPTDGSRYGDAIFVADEGTLFAPSFLGGKVAGMHGYDLGTSSTFSALASDKPIPDEVSSITSVAGVVRRTLGVGT
jgi:Type I phosphodiesterase / nucleotide pyrophosphatase